MNHYKLNKKSLARGVLAFIVIAWISIMTYTIHNYDIMGNDNQLCGKIVSMKSTEEITGGKSKIAYTALYGSVDFGSPHGTWTIKLDPVFSYDGIGSQYCISAARIDKNDPANVPKTLEVITVFGVLISIFVGLVSGLFLIYLVFATAFGDDK